MRFLDRLFQRLSRRRELVNEPLDTRHVIDEPRLQRRLICAHCGHHITTPWREHLTECAGLSHGAVRHAE